MNEPTFICTRCHSEFPVLERREFEGRDYCTRCHEAITTVCHVCGARIKHTRNHGTRKTPLCECCLHARSRAGVQDYYYQPRPIFYGRGPRYLGVELEIDCGGESDSSANEIMSVANAEKPIVRDNFDAVVALWRRGEITAAEAQRRLDMKPSTFYRKVRRS